MLTISEGAGLAHADVMRCVRRHPGLTALVLDARGRRRMNTCARTQTPHLDLGSMYASIVAKGAFTRHSVKTFSQERGDIGYTATRSPPDKQILCAGVSLFCPWHLPKDPALPDPPPAPASEEDLAQKDIPARYKPRKCTPSRQARDDVATPASSAPHLRRGAAYARSAVATHPTRSQHNGGRAPRHVASTCELAHKPALHRATWGTKILSARYAPIPSTVQNICRATKRAPRAPAGYFSATRCTRTRPTRTHHPFGYTQYVVQHTHSLPAGDSLAKTNSDGVRVQVPAPHEPARSHSICKKFRFTPPSATHLPAGAVAARHRRRGLPAPCNCAFKAAHAQPTRLQRHSPGAARAIRQHKRLATRVTPRSSARAFWAPHAYSPHPGSDTPAGVSPVQTTSVRFDAQDATRRANSGATFAKRGRAHPRRRAEDRAAARSWRYLATRRAKEAAGYRNHAGTKACAQRAQLPVQRAHPLPPAGQFARESGRRDAKRGPRHERRFRPRL
ncbi:hypothetical protein FB451DRAFT_1413381 [Mycena latifolia]|nr:hypothetical protein FB451DRAFT_1413381 [Mycena latifolia]